MRRDAAEALAPIRDEFREALRDVLDGEPEGLDGVTIGGSLSNTQTTTSMFR